MRRPTSVLSHVLLTAAAGLLLFAPVSAQSTPPPSPAIAMPVQPMPPQPDDLMMPSPQRGTPTRPASAPAPGQGQQGQQGGQTMTPPAAAPRPETPRAPYIAGPNTQPMPPSTNIRLDLTITDTFTGTPVKKAVSLIVLTSNNGMIRTTSSDGWAILNVDAIAAAYSGGQVSVRMTFEYTPAQAKERNEAGQPAGRAPRLNESITVALQDGKPMMVSQSADPATDRKVTAELTATILK
jgi:hypothetical protein